MKPIRLLVCDDVDDLRLLLRLACDVHPGFEVVGEARDGEQSVAAARELRPDAVLLDIHMPLKSGLQALPEVRQEVPDAGIVIYSGFQESTLRDMALGLGADAYIEKGTTVDEILGLLRTAVEGRRRDRNLATGRIASMDDPGEDEGEGLQGA